LENYTLRTRPFTRPTIVAAVEFLGAALSQANFNRVIVRLGFNPEFSLASALAPSSNMFLNGRQQYEQGGK